MDLMEMPLTALGNRYLLMFMYYLMKWVETYPLPDQTSETIARILVDRVICQHEAPRVIDRGANFLSGVTQDFCVMRDMKMVNNTAYNPQMDGLVEKFSLAQQEVWATAG